MTTIARRPRDLAELLNDLEQQVIECGAIKQAAHDFVTLKENTELYTDEHQATIARAYADLKDLVYS